jgi:hypothetical protein
MARNVVKIVECNTVGDLLDELAKLAKDPEYQAILDAPIESPIETFGGFKVLKRTLSDKSEVIDFELFEE